MEGERKKSDWILSKSKERRSLNFVKTLLELSGYRVMNFGIENHNREIVKLLKANYATEMNRRLLSMPDFVVLDEETGETWLIEVKHRSFRNGFDMKKSNITLNCGMMKDYLDFWRGATLVLTFNVKPYCLCVDFDRVNWSVHFKSRCTGKDGKPVEAWNFSGIYQIINDKFPKVTSENFKKALDMSGIGK